MTIKELSAYLRVSWETVERMIKRGDIKAEKRNHIGNHGCHVYWFISDTNLNEFMTKNLEPAFDPFPFGYLRYLLDQ